LSPIAQDSKAKKKAKKVADDSGEGGSGGVHVEMTQHVSLTFSLKYLVNFSKSAVLSDTVQLMLKNDVPLLVRIFQFMGNSSDLITHAADSSRCHIHLDRAIFGTT
jgi:hypothetical protein